MQLRCKGLTECTLRIEAEQSVEGLVAVVQPSVRRPAQDGIALCIDESSVARLALDQARIGRGRRRHGLFQPGAGRLEMRNLALQQLDALAGLSTLTQEKTEAEGSKSNEADQLG